MENRILIAKRVAQELEDGDVVNLGIGIPTLVANYIANDKQVILHSENGFIGLGPAGETTDPDLSNAGGQPAGILPGGATFDSAMSFVIVRGGHLDATVLGALEVDQEGNLANWMVPGKIVPGMGGAMDLVVGAKRVIVAMEHVGKGGVPKIVRKCTLPLTASQEVDLIITDLCVFQVTNPGLLLTEIAPGVTLQTVREATAADYIISPDIKEMAV
ncbi:3-oxoacid CoA-transferase subunit B [Sporomusa termitida]|uniref:Acetate CoA-transferase subunit beta n=1 Tax=Sporomusa termitida TaxID=2377 RepID=A0A517DVU1_9FIRM|nr:3-oxoacid CoA-transferase subunit B [Sporomusa termitida]QDR81461.1 Acetate CoA-transferase subunit beta [Sporomusa termitida]